MIGNQQTNRNHASHKRILSASEQSSAVVSPILHCMSESRGNVGPVNHLSSCIPQQIKSTCPVNCPDSYSTAGHEHLSPNSPNSRTPQHTRGAHFTTVQHQLLCFFFYSSSVRTHKHGFLVSTDAERACHEAGSRWGSVNTCKELITYEYGSRVNAD